MYVVTTLPDVTQNLGVDRALLSSAVRFEKGSVWQVGVFGNVPLPPAIGHQVPPEQSPELRQDRMMVPLLTNQIPPPHMSRYEQYSAVVSL